MAFPDNLIVRSSSCEQPQRPPVRFIARMQFFSKACPQVLCSEGHSNDVLVYETLQNRQEQKELFLRLQRRYFCTGALVNIQRYLLDAVGSRMEHKRNRSIDKFNWMV
jgi:hypothetical protein